jgi:nucleoside-diphosphate-sugar epimerase
MSRHVLVAGAGWLGSALARALLARGERVTAVRRRPGLPAALEGTGAVPLALDLAEPGAAARLPRDVDAVVACQAAGADAPEAYRRTYVDATAALLAAAPRAALVYTGSTGVFGQRDGSDVDEATPPAPASASAEVLVEAERLIARAAAGGARACTVRLSGLYGPGRTGLVDRVRSGALALGPGDDAWMNFCHLEDAVGAVLAALERGRAGAAYHASDAAPTRRREVVTWIAWRLGIPPPARAAPPEPARAAHRRVLSTSTRSELAVTLRFPSFRDGLDPLLPGQPLG